MKLYRFLTGPEDASFCHKVTEALNQGWELYGSPQLTFDPNKKQLVCAQAVIKTVTDKTYDPEMKLSDQ